MFARALVVQCRTVPAAAVTISYMPLRRCQRARILSGEAVVHKG
jgi:hypothetical protein